jgi:hypothetical protein
VLDKQVTGSHGGHAGIEFDGFWEALLACNFKKDHLKNHQSISKTNSSRHSKYLHHLFSI